MRDLLATTCMGQLCRLQDKYSVCGRACVTESVKPAEPKLSNCPNCQSSEMTSSNNTRDFRNKGATPRHKCLSRDYAESRAEKWQWFPRRGKKLEWQWWERCSKMPCLPVMFSSLQMCSLFRSIRGETGNISGSLYSSVEFTILGPANLGTSLLTYVM